MPSILLKKGLGAFFMTKKQKGSIIFLIWGIVIIQLFVNNWQKQKMMKAIPAFQVMEDRVEECISGYGYFGDMELDDETKKKMLENLASHFGLTNIKFHEPKRSVVFDQEGKRKQCSEKMKLSGRNKTGTLQLQIVTISEKGKQNQQYILMECKSKMSISEGQSLFQEMKKVYQEIGVQGTVSIEHTFEQDGNLEDTYETVAKKYLKEIHAKTIGSMKEDGICTVYGCLPGEPTYYLKGGKKGNVQILFRYRREQNKTEIKIGIPIVNSSY